MLSTPFTPLRLCDLPTKLEGPTSAINPKLTLGYRATELEPLQLFGVKFFKKLSPDELKKIWETVDEQFPNETRVEVLFLLARNDKASSSLSRAEMESFDFDSYDWNLSILCSGWDEITEVSLNRIAFTFVKKK